MQKAYYFETFRGKDYYRDDAGNVYTITDGKPTYCSNLKNGKLTEAKAEPWFHVSDVELIKEEP